jgi:hypothetical protein
MGLHVGDEAVVPQICLQGDVELSLELLVSLQKRCEGILAELGTARGSGVEISPELIKDRPDAVSFVQNITDHPIIIPTTHQKSPSLPLLFPFTLLS